MDLALKTWFSNGNHPKNALNPASGTLPKTPHPSRFLVGLMVVSHPIPRSYEYKGNPGFLGHIWILGVEQCLLKLHCLRECSQGDGWILSTMRLFTTKIHHLVYVWNLYPAVLTKSKLVWWLYGDCMVIVFFCFRTSKIWTCLAMTPSSLILILKHYHHCETSSATVFIKMQISTRNQTMNVFVPGRLVETQWTLTPLKINMEHNHAGLEDHCPF